MFSEKTFTVKCFLYLIAVNINIGRLHGGNPNVLHQILNGDEYDHSIRPDQLGSATVVNVTFLVTNIHSISEISMDYGITVFFIQEWNDPRLVFNESEPIDLRSGSELMDKIWMPDPYFVNEKKGHIHGIAMTNRQLRVNPDGHIMYDMRVSLVLICYMKLHNFPFDEQECGIKLESFGYTVKDVIFQWHPDGVIFSDIVVPDFTISHRHKRENAQNYTLGQYSRLEYDFALHRQVMYYIMENYVPSSLLVIISWVSFLLKPDSTPARASIGITTVLTLATLSSGSRHSLPKVPYTKAIDIWMFVCTCFVFVALLEFALIVYVAKTVRDPNRIRLKKKTKPEAFKMKQLRLRFCPRKTSTKVSVGKERENLNDGHEDYVGTSTRSRDNSSDQCETKMPQECLATKIDKFSRVLFPTFFAIFNIVYWIYYLVLSKSYVLEIH